MIQPGGIEQLRQRTEAAQPCLETAVGDQVRGWLQVAQSGRNDELTGQCRSFVTRMRMQECLASRRKWV